MKQPDKPYVVVVWNDAHGTGEDVTPETMKHYPMVYRSPGWLLRSDEAGVSIATEWCATDGSFRGHTFVPRQMVVEEHVYALMNPRKKKAKHEVVSGVPAT
jgi:hypothetical protein